MEITGISNTNCNNHVRENWRKRYSDVSEYFAYLKDKYPCLSDPDYKVTISPAYLKKCIKDPKQAEEFEKILDHLPISHQNLITGWNALGAEVKNEEWVFYEDGTGGMSPNMYVTKQNSSSGDSVQDEFVKKGKEEKYPSQEYYEKKKYLREQFEEKQAKKEMYAEQQESTLLRKQNASRVIERYESGTFRL